MTFKQFEEILAERRPEVRCVQRGHMGGTAKDKVAVWFMREDGTESKVYDYAGSYADILNRLGIKVATETDIATTKMLLKTAIDTNGKPSLFSKKTRDNTVEIARLQAQLDELLSDEYIRV